MAGNGGGGCVDGVYVLEMVKRKVGVFGQRGELRRIRLRGKEVRR